MTSKPSTAREALIAELLGDVQDLLVRLELADRGARATAESITSATAQYREQVDELVERLRAETAAIVLRTTEHAAKALISQQQETLQRAASQAMREAFSSELRRRTRRDWLMAVGVSAMCAGLTFYAGLALQAWLAA